MFTILGYSKEQQLGKRAIPKMKNRTKITKEQYAEAVKVHGNRCRMCGDRDIQMHHIKYRSQGGKGGWRNLVPLCPKHHALVHSDRMLSDLERNLAIAKYGEYYWCDKYDLYQEGLIENSDDDEFEAFMINQEPEEKEPERTVFTDFEFPF